MRLPGHRPPCLTGIDPEWSAGVPSFPSGLLPVPRRYKVVICLAVALIAWQTFIDAFVIGYFILR